MIRDFHSLEFLYAVTSVGAGLLRQTRLPRAEFDPLRDEGEAYAERLRQAGVSVTETMYPGTIHAFASMLAVVTDERRAIQEVAQFVRGMGGRR